VRSVLGVDLPGEDHAHSRGSLDGHPVEVVTLAVAGSPGARLDAGPQGAEALWRALTAAGAQPAGLVVYDILRVEAGVAEPGLDIDENVYPQEARLEAAFSLDKGCYIGQEVVAKIDTYGGLNKRLTGLRVSHDDPVARGTPLLREDDGAWRELGLVTSWAYSFALDTGLVLGYVKRRHQEPGTVFRLGDGPATATVVDLPVRPGVVRAV
jgi:folate-binding protein YgfZ